MTVSNTAPIVTTIRWRCNWTEPEHEAKVIPRLGRFFPRIHRVLRGPRERDLCRPIQFPQADALILARTVENPNAFEQYDCDRPGFHSGEPQRISPSDQLLSKPLLGCRLWTRGHDKRKSRMERGNHRVSDKGETPPFVLVVYRFPEDGAMLSSNPDSHSQFS